MMIKDNKKKDAKQLKNTKNDKNKKKVESSSDESSNSESDKSENESQSEEEFCEDDKFDLIKYRKFLSKQYPSKHMNQKVELGKKLKNKLKTIEPDNDEENNKNKVNIFFTIGGYEDDDDEEWEDDDEDDDEVQTENEDEPVSSDESSEEEENNSDTSESDSDEEDDEEEEPTDKKMQNKSNKNIKQKQNKNNKQKETKQKKTDAIETNSEEMESLICAITQTENTDINIELLNKLNEVYNKNKNNKMIKKCIHYCETNIEKQKQKEKQKEEKTRAKNLRIFKKIIKDKNTNDDFSFYDKLEIDRQKTIIKELREINKIIRIEKPYRMSVLESNIPIHHKAIAMKKMNSLREMERSGMGEFYKLKNWVDNFMRIPFNKYEGLPVNINDGVDKCHEFMESAQKILDNAVYGLNDAKMQIMQMLGQLVTNPASIGSTIAIHGPPGTGKTSLVKDGISKILNRPFQFIALGGATDSSFLEGHSYTYEGSTWGKIVQILLDSKCMNPVIYFDELDKISDTPRGEEIAGILTHLTDTTQNSQFHDKYFAEIDFDLSKCLFIFSYNDESKVNPILKDRMYKIKTNGYNLKDKLVISNRYLLPKIREQVRFDNEQILIPDETLQYIIDHLCNKEDGVRNLKRCLEIIYTKLNLYRLMRPGTNLFEKEMSLQVEFPFKISKDIVDKLIKIEKHSFNALYSMYT
jgi:ATP-dependent Lon protease